MESKEELITEKVPWLGIIGIIYGLFSWWFVGFIAHMQHYWGTDKKVLPQAIILVFSAIIISHLSLCIVLMRRKRYKWKMIPLIAVGISYIVLAWSTFGIVVKPSLYEHQLKSEIAGTTLIKVSANRIEGVQEFPDVFDFEVGEKKNIQEIIENIKIAPFGYGTVCECGGECTVEFYRDKELCVEMTCHHGRRFRWPESKAMGDMELTNESSAFFKRWLTENGNYTFD